MSTLLFRLIGPLQSWDSQSDLEERGTGREPSKSGVTGLLCAALGKLRNETSIIAAIAELQMGVRIDQEGYILRDYHTAGIDGYMGVDGRVTAKNPIVSRRYYLSDAAFLVGLEGEQALLEQLHAALRDPHWMLFLGRKACPPSLPVYLSDGLRDEGLRTALESYPWLGSNIRQYKTLDRLRLVLDDDHGPQVRHDHPISFEKGNRQFAPRRIQTHFIDKPPMRTDAATDSPDAEEPITLMEEAS